MIDLHNSWHTQTWWVMPQLNIFWLQINSYSFFVLLALIVWITITIYISKKEKNFDDNMIYVVLIWIFGWIIWAKIPIWLSYLPIIIEQNNLAVLLSGRTITGWLIWWTLAVIIAKKYLKINKRFWNKLVPWIIIAIAIWRMWCFMAGCCYWKITSLPWWVNFWDNLTRHPTQIYEIIYLLILFNLYLFLKNKKLKNWFLFDLFLLFYFLYRFLIEFIRVEPIVFYNFTWYQIASIIVVLYVSFKIILKKSYKK